MLGILVVIITLVLTSYVNFEGGKDKIEETLGADTKISEEDNTPQPTSSQKPTTAPILESTQTPTPAQTSSSSIDEWVYPGASVTTKSSNSLSFETRDDTEAVTNWYKDKINSKGFSAKSFVTTKANDNILNKLSGAKENQEVSVEIKKAPGEVAAKVVVNLN